jgi:serine/threonine protein kinase
VGIDDDEHRTDAHDPFAAGDETITTVNAHLAPGTDVGGYLVDGELGSGGMGVVYSATHPVIGKRAAIKVLKPELSRNPAAVERFIMEARAVNQIGHPNIVDIFAFGTMSDGRSYYVMDYLQGETLRKRVKRGPLHISEASSVIDEVCSALMAAHDKGIIHRDLKPDNVFMVSVPGRWPEVRILDWGLLKLSSTQSAVSSGKYRTLAGSVMGTPVYMSPEQARASDTVDFRCDIYSLGVMSFELLSGVVPFKKGSSIDTLLAHQDDPVPSLAAKCPALPEEVVQLIEAMLAKDPKDRPTLAAIRAVLKRLKGTKIPTMTAAGLAMPPGPGTPFTEPSTNSHPTYNGSPSRQQQREPERPEIDLTPSMAHTSERRTPEPGTMSMSEVLPLPAPPPTPMPDQPSMSPYASMNLISQTTLAGHSMPGATSNPRLPAGVSMQHQQFPPLMAPNLGPQGSQPPQAPHPSQAPQYQSQSPYPSQAPQYQSQAPQYQSQSPYPSQAPQYQQRPPTQPPPSLATPAQSGNKRVFVVLIAALLVSAVGIVLLVLAN